MEQNVLAGEIWSQHQTRRPRLLSILIHLTILLVALTPTATLRKPLPEGLVHISLYQPSRLVIPADVNSGGGGGGGGGRHESAPPSLGKLPTAADRQFVPPDPEPPKNPDPSLVVEASIVAPQLASLPRLSLISIGDPDGVLGPPSAGPGTGYGVGNGDGHGTGSDKGPGAGPDGDGGCCGRLHVGGGITAPVLLSEVLPEYSEEARKARFEGTVILDTIVREDGSVQVMRVLRGVGFGLDQSAIAAVLRWKFKPAHMNGKPVPVGLNMEVSFNLR